MTSTTIWTGVTLEAAREKAKAFGATEPCLGAHVHQYPFSLSKPIAIGQKHCGSNVSTPPTENSDSFGNKSRLICSLQAIEIDVPYTRLQKLLKNKSMPDFKDIALKIKETDKPYSMSVRDLMKSIGHYRRSTDANRILKNRLRRHKLTVEPDFELVNIETRIQIFPLEGKGAIKKTDINPKAHQTREAEPTATTERSEEEREIVLTIGQLPSAVREPTFVTRDEPIARAITLMLQGGVDHLVVSQNKRAADGLITWSSIGRARAGRGSGSKVSDCMEQEPYVVRFDALLFDTVREITRRGIALVRSSTGTIGGSVTTADIAEQFVTLSEPFLFLEQIENHLRALLRSAKLTVEGLQDLVDPRDEVRKAKVKSVDSLTFGETLRAFDQQITWEKMRLELDRKTVIDGLKKVNEIRNHVMHFHPDGISDEEREILRRTRHMLQIL